MPNRAPQTASHEFEHEVVRGLRVERDEAALVEGLRDGEPWAMAALFDEYAPYVERILRRVLGHERHEEMADLVHEAFAQAYGSLDSIRDPKALRAWMQTIAVRVAHRTIRRRVARRWLFFHDPADLPEIQVDDLDGDVVEAYRRTYAVLDRLPANLRIVFALRYVEGMDLGRLATVLEISLSTVKRRLTRAEERFAKAARREPALQSWLEEGRWKT